MKKTVAGLAILAGSLVSAQAAAQAYVGIGVLTAQSDNAKEAGQAFWGPAGGGDSSSTAVKVFGGYQWPQRFGVEVGYYNLGSYDVTNGAVKTDEFTTTAFTVAGTYAVPLGQAFDLNLKAGLAFTDVEYTCMVGCGGLTFSTSKTGTAGLLGIGLAWNVQKNFALRADVDYFGGVMHSVGGAQAEYDYVLFGVSGQFRF